MDYKEKYEMALERAREWYNKTEPDSYTCIVESIFPELKGNEDEQHRKWILEYLYDGLRKSDEQFKGQFKAAIACLKKQESLTTDEEKQGKEDVLWCIKQAKKYAKDENEMGTCWFAEQWLEKQGNKPQGKKHAWSKEDENNLTDTCVAIRKFYHGTNGAQELIDWLKFLKQRAIWKPSDKQIMALRWVLNNIPYNKHKEEISGLLDQIKDL